MTIKDFFTDIQKKSIQYAIENAEENTSGEIRIHIENNCKSNPVDRAFELFGKLKMHETKLRNGVLIYLAIRDKKFAIVGDKGINEIVKQDFWDEVKELMQLEFQKGEFTVGLCQVIEITGKKLKQYFPYEKNDTNELTNDISFEDN